MARQRRVLRARSRAQCALPHRESRADVRFSGCTNNPKQPFSRQNYIATLGGPLMKDKVWLFSSFEYVHENASIAYSPNSTAQFNALSTLASEGLIPGVGSIVVPANVPIPFRDYIGSLRFDWAQSAKSQWFLRTSEDNYITHNALVAQATLPSTGLTTHNNYWNTVLSNTYAFNSRWLGTFVFDASELHLTQVRNSTLGFALAFPFSATSLTVSGFETFGDNQFATPITLFPSLRNQEKYQFRYDVSHATGDHAFKFGVNFIHEPALSGAFPGNQETLYSFPNDPTFYLTDPAQFTADYAAGASTTPAGDGSFSQSVQRLALYAEDSWRVTPAPHGELWLALADDLRPVYRIGPQPGRECRFRYAAGTADSGERAARLPQAIRPSHRHCLLSGRQRQNRDPRRLRHVLQRSRAERMGHRFSGCQFDQCRCPGLMRFRCQHPRRLRAQVASPAMPAAVWAI